MSIDTAWQVGGLFGFAVAILGIAFLPSDRRGTRMFSLLVGSFVLAGAIAKLLYTGSTA